MLETKKKQVRFTPSNLVKDLSQEGVDVNKYPVSRVDAVY